LRRKIIQQFANPEYQETQSEIYNEFEHARSEILSTQLDSYDA